MGQEFFGMETNSMLRNPRQVKFTRANRFERIRTDQQAPGAIYDNQPNYLQTGGFSFAQAGRPKPGKYLYPPMSNDTLKSDLAKHSKCYSNYHNFLIPVFGSERKDQILNATILKAHEHANYGKHSPGPATYDARGDIPLDKGRPFGVKTKIIELPSSTPAHVGPCKYGFLQESLGQQFESRKRNMPTFKFSKAPIPGRDDVEEIPEGLGGKPWFYDSIGKQFDSRKRNACSVGFVNGTRQQRDGTTVCYTGLDKAAEKVDVQIRIPTLPDQRSVLKYTS